MRKLLLTAAAAALLCATPSAFAQQNGPGDTNGPNDNPAKHDNANRNDRQDTEQGGPAASPMQGPQDRNAQPRDRNMPDRDQPNQNTGPDRDDRTGQPNTIMKVRPGTPNQNTVVRKTVDRTVVMKARANVQAPRRFHIAVAYRQPAGFYVHHWVFGERLPVAFFARDYWIADFAVYGLMEPWAGYEWVRVGDDALLVDIDTGEVIRVEYGLFY
jgi:Ni/Co efflux regulator RcnB